MASYDEVCFEMTEAMTTRKWVSQGLWMDAMLNHIYTVDMYTIVWSHFSQVKQSKYETWNLMMRFLKLHKYRNTNAGVITYCTLSVTK